MEKEKKEKENLHEVTAPEKEAWNPQRGMMAIHACRRES
jgi:hypothetical protein